MARSFTVLMVFVDEHDEDMLREELKESYPDLAAVRIEHSE